MSRWEGRGKEGREEGHIWGGQLALGFKVRKHLVKQSSLSFSLLMCGGEESYKGEGSSVRSGTSIQS